MKNVNEKCLNELRLQIGVLHSVHYCMIAVVPFLISSFSFLISQSSFLI